MKHASWLIAGIALWKDPSQNALKPKALVHLKYGVYLKKQASREGLTWVPGEQGGGGDEKEQKEDLE